MKIYYVSIFIYIVGITCNVPDGIRSRDLSQVVSHRLFYHPSSLLCRTPTITSSRQIAQGSIFFDHHCYNEQTVFLNSSLLLMLIFYNMKLHRQYRTLTLSVKSHHTFIQPDLFSYSDSRGVANTLYETTRSSYTLRQESSYFHSICSDRRAVFSFTCKKMQFPRWDSILGPLAL